MTSSGELLAMHGVEGVPVRHAMQQMQTGIACLRARNACALGHRRHVCRWLTSKSIW